MSDGLAILGLELESDERLARLHASMDMDGNGTVDWDEFEAAVWKAEERLGKLPAEEGPESTLGTVASRADAARRRKAQNNPLVVEAWRAILHHINSAKDPNAAIARVFTEMDTDCSGGLDVTELCAGYEVQNFKLKIRFYINNFSLILIFYSAGKGRAPVATALHRTTLPFHHSTAPPPLSPLPPSRRLRNKISDWRRATPPPHHHRLSPPQPLGFRIYLD